MRTIAVSNTTVRETRWLHPSRPLPASCRFNLFPQDEAATRHTDSGQLGWLVTDPSHTRKGLAGIVVKSVMNRLMAEGQMPEPQYFENHIVHKTVLNRYMKTEAYRKLPPDRQHIFQAHDALHSQLLAPEPPPQPEAAPSDSGEEVPSPSSQEPAPAAAGNGSQPPLGG